MTIKTIILDFDGVIVESEEIKNQAFRDLFSDYPQYLDQIMSYHLEHKTTSRYEKFEHIVTHILGESYGNKRAEEINSQFSPLVRQRIIECPFVPGATDFLDYFSSMVPLYLVSATPQEELEIIVKARDIASYFKGIYGNPWEKSEVIQKIMSEGQIDLEAVVYIGDSISDYQAARETGVFFVGRLNKDPFDNLGILVYKDMSEIQEYLQSTSPK